MTSKLSGADPWTRPAGTAAERQVRHVDRMAEELRHLGARFSAATDIGIHDRVLDIGCGAGESTRDAGLIAEGGSVLGVDISAAVVERARDLTEQAGLHNVSYLQADAQVHEFAPEHFELCISRFGCMFFTDPAAAFDNIARALRPRARLVMMVWQSRDVNEWFTMVREAAGPDAPDRRPGVGEDAFALADPDATTALLSSAGLSDIAFADVREPVYYGPDVEAAYRFVTGMQHAKDLLAHPDAATAEGARRRLRAALAEHDTESGVYVGSRAWIVTARR